MGSLEKLSCYEQVCENAQAGPWYAREVNGVSKIEVDKGEDIARNLTKHNANFVATARKAMPELIARIRALESEADWLAQRGSDFGCPTREIAKVCQVMECTVKARTKCWRDAASMAVHNA